MITVKEDEVILEGKRNNSDGIWDIPVYKTEISQNNYRSPSSHPSMYLNSNTLYFNHEAKAMLSSKSKIKKHRLHKILRKYKFNSLIQDNIDDYHIKQQLQQDAKKYCPINVVKDTPSLAIIIQKKRTHMELAQYLHTACFSPVNSTFVAGIKNQNFTSWPGMTPNPISKHLPKSVATVQGHIHQKRQNLQSTKKVKMLPSEITKIRERIARLKKRLKPGHTLQEGIQEELQEDSFPSLQSPNIMANDVI